MALKGEVIEKIAALITAAFGLVQPWHGMARYSPSLKWYSALQKPSRACLYTPYW
ncbi:MAG: hypothetical protein WAV32_03645 [Halobacteriota archaeon]